MNIKRFVTLVLVILFAAPFAAFGDVEFTDQVIRDDNAPLLVKLRQIQENRALGLLPMTAPTSTRVDTLVLYPHSWSAAETAAFMGELALADAYLHQVLANSNTHWLTFPRVGAVRLSHDATGSYSPRTDPEAQSLRVQYGADRVIAVVDEYPVGGSAELCGPYATVRRTTLSEGYAHELLHTVCLDHNPESAVSPPVGFENNRAMHVCPEDGGDGFATLMTQYGVPCGWYNTNSLTGPGIFYNGVELVGEHQQATLVLQVAAPLAAAEMDAPLGPCVPDDTTMCLDSSNGSDDRRFEIRVAFETTLNGGQSGFGRPTMLSDSTESGLFSFFAPSNKEMLIKVINACGFNNHFWVFFGTTTNVGFSLDVRDTVLNNTWSYDNEDLTAGQIQDINALPCN